jgi:signal transduction histidine kinase
MKQRSLQVGPSSSAGELMAAVAHEIGTPMTTILGYAELLVKSVADDRDRQRAATIVEQVQRVSRLTEKLLALSRVPVGSPGPVELDALLETALASADGALTRRGVRLERRFAPVPPVLAEARRLEQVVTQLLLEAVEATPREGTLRVSLARRPGGEVEVCASHPERGCGESPGQGARFRLALPALG